MIYDHFCVEEEGGVALLRIHDPRTLNALSRRLLEELDRVLDEVEAWPGLGALVLTGEGRAFVSGADIREMTEMSALEARAYGELGAGILRRLERLPIPVIAAVNGAALGGGCELAMACDVRLASREAVFGLPEVGLGVIPGFNGTQRLPRLVGVSKALELILSGARIPAEEACRIGLVSRVLGPEELLPACMELAGRMARNAPKAVAGAKAAVLEGLARDPEAGAALEAALFGLCFSTEDQREGMRAFLEKRPPCFRGR